MPAPAGVDAAGRPLGDLDEDCDVDLADYAALQRDFVDLDDYAVMAANLTGPR